MRPQWLVGAGRVAVLAGGAGSVLLTLAPQSVVAGAAGERHARLVVPKIVPDARPVLVTQMAHSGDVQAMAFSPDGRSLATGARDNRAILWDASTGRAEMVLDHRQAVTSLSFSPDGQALASVSGGHLTVWDSDAGLLLGRLDLGLGSPAYAEFSPDGRALACWGHSNDIRLFAWPESTLRATFRGHTGRVADVGFSSDGRLLASCSQARSFEMDSDLGEATGDPSLKGLKPSSSVPGAMPAEVIVWGLLSGEPEQRIRGRPPGAKESAVTAFRVSDPVPRRPVALKFPRWPDSVSVSFTPDGRTLAWASADGTVTLSDLEGTRPGTVLQTGGPVVVARVSANGKRLAARCTDGSAVVWELPGATVVARRERQRRVLKHRALALNPAGTRLALATDNPPAIAWEPDPGREVPLGASAYASSGPVCFSPDGGTLLTGAGAAWSLGGGTADRLAGSGLAAFSRDGAAAALVREGRACVLETRGGVPRAMPSSSPTWVCLSPDGSLLAAPLAAPPGQATPVQVTWPCGLWDAATGKLVAEMRPSDDALPAPRKSAYPPEGQKWSHWPIGACFGPDGRKWASVWLSGSLLNGAQRTSVAIWDLASGQIERVLGPEGQAGLPPSALLSFTPDGAGLLCVTGRSARLWDVVRGERIGEMEGGADAGSALAISADGTRAACGSVSQDVLVWDLRTGKVVSTLAGHTARISGLCFSPDGRRLGSASEDGTVRLWDLRRSRQVAAMVLLSDDRGWLITTPEGYYDCSLDADQAVVWRLGSRTYPFEQFAGKYRRPDLVRRALAGEDLSGVSPLDGTGTPPNVIFTEPAYDSEVTQATVTLGLRAAGVCPIDRVVLTVNGRPPWGRMDRVTPGPTPNESEFAVTVGLPPNEPRIRVRAVAYDAVGLRSRPVEISLRRSGAPQQSGRLLVVAIGLSRYRGQTWNTLQYADADAIAFADSLAKQQGRLYSPVIKRVLTNEQATVSGVKFALRWLKDTAAEGDVAVVLVAGHGVEPGGGYYFICHDTTEADLAATALPWQDFTDLLQDVRARLVLLAADTCHAGFVTGTQATDHVIDRLNRNAGAVVFAASRGDEPSIERADWGHGAFTKALLEAFDGAADVAPGDGRLTLRELRDFVTRRTEELTGGKQHPFLPRLEQFDPEAAVATLPGPLPSSRE